MLDVIDTAGWDLGRSLKSQERRFTTLALSRKREIKKGFIQDSKQEDLLTFRHIGNLPTYTSPHQFRT